jgi:CRP-like cAMP-binding protein
MATFSSFVDLLTEIEDPRRAEGKLYRLPHVVLFAILAIVAGANSYRTIHSFIDVHLARLRDAFGVKWRKAPAYTTIRGDLIGLPASLFEGAIASISGLTDTTISPLQFEELFGLFRHYPRISTALFWTSAREAGIYVERLATIGRRSAYERLAHLILELLSRLQVVGQASPNTFEMPLTQEMLADTLGLSLQHANRMIRNLREEGLASIQEHKVTIHDMESLVRLAGFEDTYLSRHKIAGLSR